MKTHQDVKMDTVENEKLSWQSPTLTDLDSLSATEGKDSTNPLELADTVGPS
jgi:hypothetical protein